jgi:hypothetical protein
MIRAMSVADLSLPSAMATQIQSSLHSTFADLPWVVDAYALTLASLLLTSGSHAHAMLDLSLYEVPTLSVGSIAGLAMSAGSFSAFLHLVPHLQDVLRYSPLQTGVRSAGPLGHTVTSAAGQPACCGPFILGPASLLVSGPVELGGSIG